MQEMYREEFWQKRGRPRELYLDASSKDAPIPPDLPVPNCESVTVVFRSTCFNRDIQTQRCVASTHAVILM